LEFIRLGRRRGGDEFSDIGVEQSQKRDELFRGEGSIAALDFAETCLRKSQMARELGLRPASIGTQLANLLSNGSADFISGYGN
jgi:hypothetical protein